MLAMGIVERRQREKQQMRRQILDTAMDLFIENGYEEVSIRRIADHIEYSPATIYLYFQDKDDILFVLHEEGFEKMIAEQAQVSDIADPLERLIRIGEVYVRFGLAHPEYYELMFILKNPMRKLKSDDAYCEWGCGIRSYDFLRQAVRDCVAAGFFTDADSEVLAIAMWAQVHGFVALILRDRLHMIPAEMREQLVEGFLQLQRAMLTERRLLRK
jgi:AcrR family transcriptional regulator